MIKSCLKTIRPLLAASLFVPMLGFGMEVDPNKEYRVALVIGNSDYQFSPLKNPVNDATDIARTLEELGFDVVLGTDLNRKEIRQKVREFGDLLEKADIGFFYFAGHGLQYDGENFLVPVSVDIQSEEEIPDEALSTDGILKRMDKAGNAVNIVVLDACRNNPFARSFRSGTRGLSRIEGPTGSFIAYATAPGNVAADGKGRNGLYTQYLLNEISKPGLAIEQVFKKVRVGVIEETSGKQVPWENSSLLGDFYFSAAKSAANNKQDELDQIELQFWSSVEKANSADMYRAYLNKYPQGHFVDIANIQIDAIQKPENNVQVAMLSPAKKQMREANQIANDQNADLKADANRSSDKESLVSPGISETQKLIAQQSFRPSQPAALTIERPSRPKAKTKSKPKQSSSGGGAALFSDEQFVRVPAGCFTMGSPFGEESRQNDELDHEVCISQDFEIGKYEVTQGQWKAVMGNNPAYFKACGDDCPVEQVSWNDVQTFIFRLNFMTNSRYRLPTEAEWEYAARAGTQTSTYLGDIELEAANNAPDLDKIAWYSGNTKVEYKGGKFCEDWEDKQYHGVRCGTQAVGQKQANDWGLFDMIGNVWEWTGDWYGNYSSKQKNDPEGPKKGELKVVRGGHWAGSLDQNRAAARYGYELTDKINHLGFRLVRQK